MCFLLLLLLLHSPKIITIKSLDWLTDWLSVKWTTTTNQQQQPKPLSNNISLFQKILMKKKQQQKQSFFFGCCVWLHNNLPLFNWDFLMIFWLNWPIFFCCCLTIRKKQGANWVIKYWLLLLMMEGKNECFFSDFDYQTKNRFP